MSATIKTALMLVSSKVTSLSGWIGVTPVRIRNVTPVVSNASITVAIPRREKNLCVTPPLAPDTEPFNVLTEFDKSIAM